MKQNIKQVQMFINRILQETEDWDIQDWKKFRKEYGYEYNPLRPDLRLYQILKYKNEE